MASLNITEFDDVLGDQTGPYAVAKWTANSVVQNVTFTTATQSSAFAGTTVLLRLIADADAYVLLGTNPTATATNAIKLEADTELFIGLNPGDFTKLSVYDGTS